MLKTDEVLVQDNLGWLLIPLTLPAFMHSWRALRATAMIASPVATVTTWCKVTLCKSFNFPLIGCALLFFHRINHCHWARVITTIAGR